MAPRPCDGAVGLCGQRSGEFTQKREGFVDVFENRLKDGGGDDGEQGVTGVSEARWWPDQGCRIKD